MASSLGHVLNREMHYLGASLPRAAVNAPALMSFRMKCRKLLPRWTRWPGRSPASNLCDLKVLCYYPARSTAFSDSICKMTPQVFFSLFPPLLNSRFSQLMQWDSGDNIWNQRVAKVVEGDVNRSKCLLVGKKNNARKLEKRWKDRHCTPVSFSASKWDFDVDTTFL